MKKVLSATTLKGSDKGKLLEALSEIIDAVPLFDDRYTWDIRIIEEDGALGVEFTAKYYEENIDRWYRNIEEYGDTVDDIIANNDFYEDMIEFLSAEAEAIGIEKSITSSTVTPKRILSFMCPVCHNKTVYDSDRDVYGPLEAHYGDRFICDECGSEFEGSLGFDNRIHLDLIKEEDE